MPTFVGLQAPCDSFSGKVNPSQARPREPRPRPGGRQRGVVGLGAGTPIYYDMEGYDRTNAVCRTAVLTFWTPGTGS